MTTDRLIPALMAERDRAAAKLAYSAELARIDHAAGLRDKARAQGMAEAVMHIAERAGLTAIANEARKIWLS